MAREVQQVKLVALPRFEPIPADENVRGSVQYSSRGQYAIEGQALGNTVKEHSAAAQRDWASRSFIYRHHSFTRVVV